MAFNYDNTRATAVRLLNKFGNSLSVVLEGNSSGFDPATGDPASDTPDQSISGVGCVLNYTNSEKRAQKEQDENYVRTGDKKLIWLPDEPEDLPAVGMFVTYNNHKYRVQSVNDLNPAGVTVLYTIHLRY